MTSAFNFASPPNVGQPNLSHPLLAAVPKFPQCVPIVVLGTTDGTLPSIPYRVPYPQMMPAQESVPVRGIASGICT
jgi:phospholipase C